MFLGITSSRIARLELHAPPAVAQGDRDRALGLVLADDVAVERLHDLARGHGGVGAGVLRLVQCPVSSVAVQSVSTTMLRLV
jgi:hypothetical protein